MLYRKADTRKAHAMAKHKIVQLRSKSRNVKTTPYTCQFRFYLPIALVCDR